MRLFLILAAAFALCGCGLTSSPADNLTFQAPTGWQGTPGIMGFMQFWKAPDEKQVLMLFKSPKPLKESEVFSSAKIQDESTEIKRNIEICGHQPAVYVKGRGTTSDDSNASNEAKNSAKTPNYLELVMTNTGGSTYFAMYAYPVDMTPDAQAEAAIRELCPKQT